MGLVEIPAVMPRVVPVGKSDKTTTYLLLEDLVAEHLGSLFLGLRVEHSYPIRVTRNLDYNLLESEVVESSEVYSKRSEQSRESNLCSTGSS